MYMYVCMSARSCVTACVQRSEESAGVSSLPSCGLRGLTQIVRLGGNHLYQLRHLTGFSYLLPIDSSPFTYPIPLHVSLIIVTS